MIQIINPWMSEKDKLKYYNLEDSSLIEKNGDYAAYFQWEKSVIYTYRNIAINNLAGFNKKHFDRIVANERPVGSYSSAHFLFDRTMVNKQMGLAFLN